jgi:hypothetical protein
MTVGTRRLAVTAVGAAVAVPHTGRDAHGLCVWPQPGRFSLGHTGNMR